MQFTFNSLEGLRIFKGFEGCLKVFESEKGKLYKFLEKGEYLKF